MRWLPLLLLAGCASGFRAGVATADLTPDHAVPLGGYGARRGKLMTGIHDRVHAKALWLETKETRVCIVTTDLVGSSDEFRRDAQKRLPFLCHLILAASHNHSGPGALSKNPLLQIALGKFDQALYDSYVKIVTDLVIAAERNAKPADLEIARGSAPELQRNRRSKHYTGEAPLDPEIVVLRVGDATLTNYTAHGTVLGEENMHLSGDWAGAFQRRMKGTALYWNGAEGDISPRAPEGKDDFERCEKLGDALAAKIEALTFASMGRVRLDYVEETVDLPKAALPVLPKKSVLGVLRINDVLFFLFPGEPCVELGLELKKKYPGSVAVGLANDHLGYFLTKEQYKKGGYEKDVSFFGPDMGEFLLRAFDRLVEKLPR